MSDGAAMPKRARRHSHHSSVIECLFVCNTVEPGMCGALVSSSWLLLPSLVLLVFAFDPLGAFYSDVVLCRLEGPGDGELDFRFPGCSGVGETDFQWNLISGQLSTILVSSETNTEGSPVSSYGMLSNVLRDAAAFR